VKIHVEIKLSMHLCLP